MSAAISSTWRPSIGERVIVAEPDGFIAQVRNKVKDGRQGQVMSVNNDDYVMVRFPEQGRRKEFRHAFRTRMLAPAP